MKVKIIQISLLFVSNVFFMGCDISNKNNINSVNDSPIKDFEISCEYLKNGKKMKIINCPSSIKEINCPICEKKHQVKNINLNGGYDEDYIFPYNKLKLVSE